MKMSGIEGIHIRLTAQVEISLSLGFLDLEISVILPYFLQEERMMGEKQGYFRGIILFQRIPHPINLFCLARIVIFDKVGIDTDQSDSPFANHESVIPISVSEWAGIDCAFRNHHIVVAGNMQNLY